MRRTSNRVGGQGSTRLGVHEMSGKDDYEKKRFTTEEIPAGRASALQSNVTLIERALRRYHDHEAAQPIAWKFGDR
jgi:hypothetical protein